MTGWHCGSHLRSRATACALSSSPRACGTTLTLGSPAGPHRPTQLTLPCPPTQLRLPTPRWQRRRAQTSTRPKTFRPHDWLTPLSPCGSARPFDPATSIGINQQHQVLLASRPSAVPRREDLYPPCTHQRRKSAGRCGLRHAGQREAGPGFSVPSSAARHDRQHELPLPRAVITGHRVEVPKLLPHMHR